MGSYAEITRAIIDTTPDGLHMDPKWEQIAWHDEAVDVFVGRTALTSADFVEFGSTLLHEAPYDEIRALLQAGVIKERPLAELVATREILVVGRNVMNLANQTDLIKDPRSQPLTTLITDIGQLADDQGYGLRLRRKITREEFEPAKQAAAYIQGDFQEPVSRAELMARANDALQTEKLADGTDPRLRPRWAEDERHYLATRRVFRAVVDLGIASMALEPSAEKLEYVHRGLAINQSYHTRHDNIRERELAL